MSDTQILVLALFLLCLLASAVLLDAIDTYRERGD